MKTSYTCDHCSAPVGLHDERCPRCGKTFDAVRCPRCGHQGPPAAFVRGCPSCRYLAPVPSGEKRRPAGLFAPVMVVLLVLLAAAVVLTLFLRPS